VIGKNYCYQTGASATLFFEGRHFNPFMSAGGLNVVIDDYNTNWDFDRGKYGYIGGSNISGGMTGGRPIGYGRCRPARRRGARRGRRRPPSGTTAR